MSLVIVFALNMGAPRGRVFPALVVRVAERGGWLLLLLFSAMQPLRLGGFRPFQSNRHAFLIRNALS